MKTITGIVLLAIFTISIISCHYKNQMTIKYYGFAHDSIPANSVLIDIRQIEDYDTLFFNVQQISCNDSIPVLVVQKENILKYIRLYNPCLKDYLCILYKERNRLRIIDEKIVVDQEYDVSKLDSLMAEHYTNMGKSPYHSENPVKAMIVIAYDKIGLENFEDVLYQISESFDKTNPKTLLAIQLVESKLMMLPNTDGTT